MMGSAFYVFALVLFPSLLFLGLMTFESVVQSAIQDAICLRGINRIRHLDVELAPQMHDYFLLPIHDDATGCTGYLVHPFKTRHIETEKDLLRLLANTGGLVYNPKSSTAYSCSNDDTLT